MICLLTNSKSFPTLISLAHIISIILIVLKSQFGNNLTLDTSLLQLQDLFQGPGLITSWLWKVSTELITTQCDGELLSKLFNLVQDLENADARLRPVAFEILRHVSRPWLESVGSWLGINKEQSEKRKFSIAHEGIRSNLDGNELQNSRYGLRQNMVPKFINEGDAEIIFETGRSLRMLKNYKPQHPLANFEALGMIDPHPLEWQFSWQDAEETTIRAKEYEQTTIGEIRHFNESKRSYNLSILKFEDILVEETRIPYTSKEVAEVQIKLSNAEIESPLVPDIPAHFNILTQALVRCSTLNIEAGEGDSSRFAPPLSLLPLLSFNPIIYAQARLINHATLRLLFKEHQIRMHLSIQHRYSLFGDALFATRLSHALYDPEMHSAERRKGYSRSGESGLRLGSRDTWPPASSELRLVLTGILTESFNDSAENMTASSAELPGGLSFAVREMCEDDFSRCRDPDSIEALDFLRLQYKPPATLDAIITPSCLSKYDLLFKTLLRGTRMLFVVNQFSRYVDNRCFARTHTQVMFTRFKLEACHFVSTICNYFFDGIRVNWDIFSRRLDEIENHLDNYESRECHGLQRLRNFHEKVLDRIMFALLLRKRQEQVMKLLEEIFSIVLVFARLTRSGVDNKQGKALDEKIEDIYPRFAKKVRIFVSVCRGLSERRGLGGLNLQHEHEHDGFEKGDQSEEGGNTLGQLFLNLDMNGYYSRSEKR